MTIHTAFHMMIAEMQAMSHDSALVIVCPEGTFNRLRIEQPYASISPYGDEQKRTVLRSILSEEYHRLIKEPKTGHLFQVPIAEVPGIEHFAIVSLNAMKVTALPQAAFENLIEDSVKPSGG